jgi:hypothetical protein
MICKIVGDVTAPVFVTPCGMVRLYVEWQQQPAKVLQHTPGSTHLPEAFVIGWVIMPREIRSSKGGKRGSLQDFLLQCVPESLLRVQRA